MADREQPYDPYIPSGQGAPAGSTTHGGNQRTAALQAVRLLELLILWMPCFFQLHQIFDRLLLGGRY